MAERKPPLPLSLPHNRTWRIGIVKSFFNEEITNAQLESAMQCLKEYNIPYDVIEVPGAYEITYALQHMAQTKQYNGLVAIGCLIKGGTIHFEVIAYTVGKAIADLTIKHHLPIGFGLITANTYAQAEERTYLGYDSTYAVLDLLNKTQNH